MKQNKNTLAALGVLMVLTLAIGCRQTPANEEIRPPAAADQPTEEPAKILSQAEQEAAYEAGVKAGLRPYWQKQDVSGIKDQILDLRAPAKYLDLHLNLVIALESLEQGEKTADQAKIESAMDKLNELKTAYPWIAR